MSAPIATADFARLRPAARRTLALRLALLAGAVALLAGAFLAARSAGSELGALFPAGTRPIVVLDVSESISGPTNRRVLATLQTLASSNGTAGLVVFSDVAYELNPPGSPTSELRPLMRFFRPIRFESGAPVYPRSPWSASFQAGTRIAAGLDEARASFRRAGIHGGSVILVSDLEDPEDPSVIAKAVGDIRRAGLALRIVPLFPLPQNLALWESVAGRDAIAATPTLPPNSKAALEQEAHPFRPGVSALLLTMSALLVALLALNERLCGRLALVPEGRA